MSSRIVIVLAAIMQHMFEHIFSYSCALCLASPDCSSQPPFVNPHAIGVMPEGWGGCVGGFEGGRRGVGYACFVGNGGGDASVF